MDEKRQKSVWEDSSRQSNFPKLDHDAQVDVVIVGAGITGLTAAYLLHQAGKKVAVVEKTSVGGGTTGHTTAHLTAEYDHDYSDMLEAYDEQTCRLLSESLRDAINLVEKLVRNEKIDCSFSRVPGYYYTESAKGRETIERELATIKRLNLYEVNLIDNIPLPFATEFGYTIPNQAQMNPLPYLNALAKSVNDGKSSVFEKTAIVDFDSGSKPCVTTSSGKIIRAEQIILATHTPLGRSPLHAFLMPYRSYASAFNVNSGSVGLGLFWDTEEPYNYIRRFDIADESWVIVGGQDRKVGNCGEENSFSQLEKYIRKRFDVKNIHCQWSAQFYDSVDRLPFIGELPFSKNVFVGTGYSGDGMTLGTIAGFIISENILGRSTRYDELYQPARVKLQGLGPFVKKNFDFAKKFVVDRWPLGADAADLVELKKEHGSIVSIKGRKVAAYRDNKGQLSLFDAVCPHMRCIVHWNGALKTFDCPCHGSRFSKCGQVIEGPSLANLKPITDKFDLVGKVEETKF